MFSLDSTRFFTRTVPLRKPQKKIRLPLPRHSEIYVSRAKPVYNINSDSPSLFEMISMSEVRKCKTLIEGEFLQLIPYWYQETLGFLYLDFTVYHNFTLAYYYRRLLLVAMGASLLLFIIYAALFHNYILLFLPVGAEFQQIEDAIASSIPVSTRSTSTVVPTAQPKPNFDLSIAQDIETMQVRRINSIIGNLKSPSSIPSWWVLRNWVLKNTNLQ